MNYKNLLRALETKIANLKYSDSDYLEAEAKLMRFVDKHLNFRSTKTYGILKAHRDAANADQSYRWRAYNLMVKIGEHCADLRLSSSVLEATLMVCYDDLAA